MTDKRNWANYIFAAIGFLLFSAGIVLVLLFSNAQGIMKVLPFLCIGIGAGLGGASVGSIIRYRQMQKDPQLAKRIEVDTKDERNIAIANRAKAVAYDCTLVLFALLVIFLSLAQVKTYVTLVVVGVYLLIVFLQIFFLVKYHKEM